MTGLASIPIFTLSRLVTGMLGGAVVMGTHPRQEGKEQISTSPDGDTAKPCSLVDKGSGSRG